MNVLSLFDGMSCGRLALNSCGFNVEKYLSSEICKNAIEVSTKNWSENINLGDISKWKDWDVDFSQIDLIIGGSPCQGFSRIGGQLNFNDSRSKLFFDFAHIIDEAKKQNPNVLFMLENVQMKQEWVDVITKRLSVEPVLIDAKHFTAHSRPRLFWFNWELMDKLPDQKNLSEVLGYKAIGCSRRARYINGKNGKTYQKLEKRKDNLANCMTTVSKNCKLIVNNVERHLTVEEGCKLQAVPTDYFKGVSKSQALKMLGNGWNVDVIKFIFQSIKGLNNG